MKKYNITKSKLSLLLSIPGIIIAFYINYQSIKFMEQMTYHYELTPTALATGNARLIPLFIGLVSLILSISGFRRKEKFKFLSIALSFVLILISFFPIWIIQNTGIDGFEIILILISIGIVTIVPFGVLIVLLIRSVKKKNKKNSFVFSTALLILLLIPSAYYAKSFLYSNTTETVEKESLSHNYHELTGYSFTNENLLYEYHSEQKNKDIGYSIEVFQLADTITSYFQNPPESFFKEYPIKGARLFWEIEKWKKTPIHQRETMFSEFASHYPKESGINLKDILNEKGNYYAYKYYMHKNDSIGKIENIEFYLICPPKRIMIIINHR